MGYLTQEVPFQKLSSYFLSSLLRECRYLVCNLDEITFELRGQCFLRREGFGK